MDVKQKETIERIYALFNEYRNAYAAEWERLDRCERIYRGEHWLDVPLQDENEPRPVTPVIQSTIENVRADLMDQMPEAVVLSDGPGHERAAEMLTAVLRENHRLGRFDREYSLLLHDLLVGGYMVQETGYDPEAAGGLGAAFLRAVDTHTILFDPLCTDIQDSRAIFKFAPYPREWFEARYPREALNMREDENRALRIEDNYLARSNGEMLLLIECWQREYDADAGCYRVHMCKLAGRQLLEDSRKTKPEGYFAHGQYPFVVTPLFLRKGTALGYGFVDMFETQQRYADKLDQIILKNALMASHNKLLVTGASGFDPDDLRDWSKEVHRGENLNGVTWFPTAPLPGYLLNYGQSIRQSIREESGSNDFARGQTYGGVTAASAIAALQEAGSKLSRDMLKSAYRAFAKECYLIIDLMRQFYDEERIFRIIGETGRSEFVHFSGAALRAQALPSVGGVELGSREPVFDIVVSAEKKSTFSRLSQNETAKECYQLGFFAPRNADAALAALEMMDFEGIEKVRQRVRQNGTLAQRLEQLQSQLVQLKQGPLSGPGENLSTAAAARAMKGAVS